MTSDLDSTYIVSSITEDSRGWTVNARERSCDTARPESFRFRNRPEGLRIGDTVRLALEVVEPAI